MSKEGWLRIPQCELDKLTDEQKKARRARQKIEWINKNKEKVLRMRKENIIKTKEERKKKIAQYRKENPLIQFTATTIRRVTEAKAKSVISNLPYSQEEFINHIESLFSSGMSWDNRSEWHIDHIKPLSYFSNEGVFDINIINALSNLQPLWANDNQSKGGLK